MKCVKRHFLTVLILISLAVVFSFGYHALYSMSYSGDVVINEVCTDNLSSLYDEYGEHPDWAELYNKGDSPCDISGWFLSDDADKRNKWAFPEGTVIPGKGYLTVFFDSAVPPEPDTDESFSLGDFILTGEAIPRESTGLHASFSLKDTETLYLSAKNRANADRVMLIPLKTDTCLSRITDGSGGFVRMTPTPSLSNSKGEEVIYPALPEPVFSKESSVFNEDFDLELSSDEGDIYYTLDGSVPTARSLKYEKPLRISDRSHEENLYSALREVSVELLPYVNYKFSIPEEPVLKTVCVRAAVINDRGERSETVTKCYIPSAVSNAFRDLGIISLVSDPSGLFDHEKGIYVMGKKGEESFKDRLEESPSASRYLIDHPDTPTDGSVVIEDVKMDEYMDFNYSERGSAWEREALLSSFDDSHELLNEETLGIRVKGHRTCNFPKKSLNLYARKGYGNKVITSPFFGNDYSRLTLFAGGNDVMSITRDILITDLTRDLSFLSLDITAPEALFLNGEFWGLYRISRKLDQEFVSEKCNVRADQVIIVKNYLLSRGLPEDNVIYGDLRHFINNADFTAGTDYERFQEMVDLDSLIDYYSARIYLDDGLDWPKTNIAFWRTRKADKNSPLSDGRWRWLNFDNNSNIDYDKVRENTIYKALNGTPYYGPDEMFTALMENPDFKARFLKRFKEIALTVFEPEKAIERLDAYASEIRPYIPYEYSRYFGDRYSISDFDRDIENMRNYFRERADYIIPFVEEACR